MAESVEFAGAFPVSQNGMGDWTASTAVESPFRLDNDGEAVPDYSYSDENIDNEEAAPKRKRAFTKAGNVATLKPGGRRTTSGKGSVNERQKITRACDACKTYDDLEFRELEFR
jgi:hypothetical protein